jgi:hypothetical protein
VQAPEQPSPLPMLPSSHGSLLARRLPPQVLAQTLGAFHV